ncbi:hypothetical protein GCM10018785_21140 [Streptomyces longispororuber]|uniref:Uncharacterized protein n=1 Tax=Streptomyces longispororuber TaxID=68230 RepID=A0A919DJG3_9ACTN|nr:hypothetical protein [Streptomyces longispororuber]GHE51175.1 hypothetical protein GCM10018785_21140 [Streptomyces longispororuber]
MAETTVAAGAVTWLTEAGADVRGALAERDRGDLAPVLHTLTHVEVPVPARTARSRYAPQTTTEGART